MADWESFGFLSTLDARNLTPDRDGSEASEHSSRSLYKINTRSVSPSPLNPISSGGASPQQSSLAVQDLLNRVQASSIPNQLLRNPTDSHELIYKMFDRHTCGILSIKDGPTENPWRSIMWPLALEHEALYNAIAAMTKFHNARNNAECRQVAMGYMKESFNLLAIGLSNKTIPLDIALATTLALALAETWDRHISTGVAHIRGASVMLKKLIPKHRGTRLPQWLQFLFNSWLYLDVVSRLTSEGVEEKSLVELSDSEDDDEPETGEQNNSTNDNDNTDNGLRDQSNRAHLGPKDNNNNNKTQMDGIVELASFFDVDDLSPKSTASDQTLGSNDSRPDEPSAPGVPPKPPRSKRRRRSSSSASSGRRELKGFLFLGQGEEIDPLMGCGQTLFPLIGRVATLVHKVRRAPKNTLTIVSEAGELKRQLEMWNPTLSARMTAVEDASWDLNSCMSTAEAYRYAALLYLHQAVPEVPSLSSHELAEKVMMLLASIPTSSRTCIIHIFPLLVAGCEAEPGEEREWVMERWHLLDQRMHIGNINCTIEVVKEVWLRKDVQARQQANALDMDSDMRLHHGHGHHSRHKHQQQQREGPRSRRSSKDIASSISSAVSHAFGNPTSGASKGYLDEGIKGWSHWSSVMNEWGWEVLLG